MKKNIVWILVAVLAVGLFVGAYFLYDRLSEDYIDSTANTTESVSALTGESESTSAAPKQKAIDFTAEDFDGKEVKLSDYFGKPIVLNFWASWCPPCKAEMPHFEKAYKENKDVQFLMVNTTTGDTYSDAVNLIKSEGYTFPVFFDTKGEASYNYDVVSLPMTIFIDKDGNLVSYHIGMISESKLLSNIEQIK